MCGRVGMTHASLMSSPGLSSFSSLSCIHSSLAMSSPSSRSSPLYFCVNVAWCRSNFCSCWICAPETHTHVESSTRHVYWQLCDGWCDGWCSAHARVVVHWPLRQDRVPHMEGETVGLPTLLTTPLVPGPTCNLKTVEISQSAGASTQGGVTARRRVPSLYPARPPFFFGGAAFLGAPFLGTPAAPPPM